MKNNDFACYEIINGLLGIHRDVFFVLTGFCVYGNDIIVKNLIGISKQSVEWLNHPHFLHARIIRPNLQKHIVRNDRLEKKKIIITTPTNLIFKLYKKGNASVFFKLLLKKIILECTFEISFFDDCKNPGILIGITVPSQVGRAMLWRIGMTDCGLEM